MNETHIQIAFIYSKMPAQEEIGKTGKTYHTIEFVEFLEFLCRISDIPDLHITAKEITLSFQEKLEKTMSAISLSM